MTTADEKGGPGSAATGPPAPPLRATYRLQLGPGLGFAEARDLVPYLADLGISHVYLSPTLQAREGSTHGYDVVDPTRISDALGGEDGLRALAAAARDAGLGLVLDVVPNHMANAPENPFWADEDKRAQFFDLDPETGRWRRFFDIDDLAGVRVEDPEVFEVTHGKVLELVGAGLVDGLRIDHPDGLADPAGYLRRLADRGVPHVWVEKIVDPGEHLRDWPVDGTTGYEFLNDVAALFTDPAGEEALTALHADMTGDDRAFGAYADEAKREQASTVFAPEVDRLRRLHDAPGLEEALSSLAVYRTYVEPWSGRVDEEDRAVLDEAGIDDPLRSALLLCDDGVPGEFVTRFQQTSPPIMAKGVEDTAFYRHVRLLSLNDVGGDPGRFGIGVAQFHAANAERLRRFPTAMLTSQTHDTKRSGDVRARIGVLSSMADDWAATVRRWSALAEPLRAQGGGPDGQELLLILQTLVGAWPISVQRMQAYLEKALREAKRNTSWTQQEHAYERGVKSFIATLLAHEPFLADFAPFAERVAEAGDRAALAQLLLKLTVPGFPDIYQGDELLALSLVDPDNRRPVDWAARRDALAALRDGAPTTRETAKLDLIRRTLDLRAHRTEPFAGAYQPIEAGDRACVFLRGADVLVGVETLPGGRDGRLFAGTRIQGTWIDVLTGEPRELGPDTSLAELLGPDGRCLLERA